MTLPFFLIDVAGQAVSSLRKSCVPAGTSGPSTHRGSIFVLSFTRLLGGTVWRLAAPSFLLLPFQLSFDDVARAFGRLFVERALGILSHRVLILRIGIEPNANSFTTFLGEARTSEFKHVEPPPARL
jgi:hypothetical protein